MNKARFLFGSVFCLFGLAACSSVAQIVLDGTVGRGGALAGPNFGITADLGQRIGLNLFHSFSQFNLAKSEAATFFGPHEVQNIVSRVTGGSASSIDGTIRSTIPGANFFLVNPAGVVFGPNASADVSGSFTVSTADYVKLGGGGRFDAKTPEASVLTSAPIEAFGFLGPNVAGIKIEGSKLSVSEGKIISVVGGDVEIKGGEMRASGGQVNLVSVKSAGEVGAVSNPDLANFAALGDIQLNSAAIVNVGGGSQPVIWSGLEADPVTKALFPSGGALGAAAPVTGRPGGGSVSIRGGSLRMDNAAIYQTTEAAGTGGSITVVTRGETVLRHEAQIVTSALGSGRSGDIRVQASQLSLEGHSRIDSTVVAAGRSGDVTVESQTGLRLTDGNTISTTSYGTGDGGSVTVKTPGPIHMDSSVPFMNAIGSQTLRIGLGGAGGKVIVESGDITVVNHPGSGISAIASRTLGAKPPGSIGIRADHILFDGGGRSVPNAAYSATIASINFFPTAIGNSGEVKIEAKSIELRNRASVTTQTQGAGNGGLLSIRVDDLQLVNVAGVFTGTIGSGNGGSVTVVAERIMLDNGQINASSGRSSTTTGTGNGGDVTVTAGKLVLVRQGEIQAVNAFKGNGGSVTVRAKELVIDSRTSDPDLQKTLTGITSRAGELDPNALGTGGKVNVSADRLEMIGSSALISSTTSRAGAGGDVTVRAGRLSLSEGAHISSASYAAGDSGTVLVEGLAPILLSGHSRITTAAEVSNAKGLTVRSESGIELRDSVIDAKAAQNGGELRLEAPSRISLVNSKVTSEAGQDGGNIFIDPQLVTLNHSQITANAIRGNGGNIRVATDFLIASTDSSITASSEFGVNGQISVLGPSVDLTGSLTTLSGSLLGAEARLPEHCGIKLGGDLSSFLILGRGGLPARSDGWQPSYGSRRRTGEESRE